MEGRRSRNQSRNLSSSSSSSSTSYPRNYPSNVTRHQSNAHSRSNAARVPFNNNKQEDAADADPQSFSDFHPLLGTCPYMCPERERIHRENLRDLALFERLHGNPVKSSPSLAVKKFCRTISTKYVQATDVRPLNVLEDTLNYLMSLLESKEHPFEVVHDFIFDRTRSIRQDLTMQNIVNKKAIYMYEQMVKFHVISHHKLRRSMSDPNIASIHHLNLEQLTKTLASLFNLYEANRNSNYAHENEAEFCSLHVLLHLDSCSKPTVNLYIIG
ncbi:SAC3 protein C [Stylosanthes scabra]|uniref:SAC3 protein C n=1 Tax=Stylosanthes scabra TaxID=79078 RepID=A0ABU6VDA1_9FABA|nr:SAC3 protein C [Stylosanthes scabra]